MKIIKHRKADCMPETIQKTENDVSVVIGFEGEALNEIEITPVEISAPTDVEVFDPEENN